jgi:hypothetical protein
MHRSRGLIRDSIEDSLRKLKNEFETTTLPALGQGLSISAAKMIFSEAERAESTVVTLEVSRGYFHSLRYEGSREDLWRKLFTLPLELMNVALIFVTKIRDLISFYNSFT